MLFGAVFTTMINCLCLLANLFHFCNIISGQWLVVIKLFEKQIY